MHSEVFRGKIINTVYAYVLICMYGDSGERKQNVPIKSDSPN